MKRLHIKIGFLLFVLVATAQGEITWTPEGGWGSCGGLLEPILGKNLVINSAEDGMNKAKEEYETGNRYAALRAYCCVYQRYPHSLQAPEALYEMGQIYMQRHQYEQAFKSYQMIIMEYPSYPKFNDVIKTQFEIASQLQCGSRPYYWGLIPGFRDYCGAIEYYESIVTNAPYSEYAPMALMNIADLAKEHKKSEDVVDALDRLISYYRASELAPRAYMMLAETYSCMVMGPEYDQGSTIRAINYYEDFLLLYPNDEQIKEAECRLEGARDMHARSKLRIGDFYYKYRNNSQAAKIYYNETITVAPRSYAAEEARQRLDCIGRGILPPKTLVDRIFGRYQPLSTPAFLAEACLEKRERLKEESIDEFHLRNINEGFCDPSSAFDGPPDSHCPCEYELERGSDRRSNHDSDTNSQNENSSNLAAGSNSSEASWR